MLEALPQLQPRAAECEELLPLFPLPLSPMRSFFLPFVRLLTCLNPLLPLAYLSTKDVLFGRNTSCCSVQFRPTSALPGFCPCFFSRITSEDWAEGVCKAAFSSFEALAKLLCPACAAGLRAEGRWRVWRQLRCLRGLVQSCEGILMFGWSEAIPTLSGDFPCINTLWHQQELGCAANSPLPVPLENLGWGAVVCRNQLLLDSGVKPLLLGLQSPDGTCCTLGLAHPYPPASCPAGWGQQPGMFYSTVILLPGM